MKLNENDIPDFIKEIRDLLGNLKGVKGLGETFSLSYVLTVETEEDKNNITKVANMLTEHAAQNHGVDLEIVAATQEEVNQATELFKKWQHRSL